MSIATELSNYQTFLTNAYNKCEDKGATIPQNKNLQNLTACIDSIPPYTKLGYIESTGTQYINTGFKATNNTKVEMKLSNFPPISVWAPPFGARTSPSSSDEYAFYRTDTGLYRSDFSGNRVTFPSGTNLTNETIVTKDGPNTTINGTTITNTSATFTATYPLFLCKINDGGTGGHTASLRLYYCKIWDNGTLVRDFIPAKDNNNVAGLYDKVTKNFYYNQGTGTFNYG